MSRLKCLFGLIRNKVDNEKMEIMFDLASCEPHRRNPNPHRGVWSSKEQLALAAPPGGRDLGWALLGSLLWSVRWGTIQAQL